MDTAVQIAIVFGIAALALIGVAGVALAQSRPKKPRKHT